MSITCHRELSPFPGDSPRPSLSTLLGGALSQTLVSRGARGPVRSAGQSGTVVSRCMRAPRFRRSHPSHSAWEGMPFGGFAGRGSVCSAFFQVFSGVASFSLSWVLKVFRDFEKTTNKSG